MDDLNNSNYWAELCGSRATYKLGISAGNEDSVKVFDDWFFEYYPYLLNGSLIDLENMKGADILEIGLGYGSVGRKLSQISNSYLGIDISSGPVEFLNRTLISEGSKAIQASALNLPFENSSFDYVVAIGCLHHTGDSERAFREAFRVLKPGGQLISMVYYAYSYKRWVSSSIKTFKKLWREQFDKSTKLKSGGRLYDRHLDGSAPPHTEFLSKKDIRGFLPEAKSIDITIRNVDNLQDLMPVRFQKRSRDFLRIWMVRKGFGKRFGLDLYLVATK